jgi:hypothetical protein
MNLPETEVGAFTAGSHICCETRVSPNVLPPSLERASQVSMK